MTHEEMAKETGVPTRSTESLRDEMCRIIEEIGQVRADRAAVLKAKFETLWKQIPEPADPTLH